MNKGKATASGIFDPVGDFEESLYLTSNPDVFKAVQAGTFSSGWQHYELYGYRENRPGVAPAVTSMTRAYMDSSPPDHLRKRVHGDESLWGFVQTGQLIANDVAAATSGKITLGHGSRILDFGCGCGRVIRSLHALFPDCEYHGSDIDAEAILWCQQHMSHIGEFVVNQELPPLPFESGLFDFVYSISVFTHLPEDMQFAWLDELRRITRPGAYLVLTVHGEQLLVGAPDVRRNLRKAGFHYVVGAGTEGLPDFYQTAFHTQAYIRKRWGAFFRVERIVKNGIAGHQDLILCRRPN